mgnify:CR=1 FL=1
MEVALYMKCIIFCLVSVLCSQAFAGNSEREELSNYLRELNKIDRILLIAKKNSLQGSSSRFKYNVFESDLAKLKQELELYLKRPNRNPRASIHKVKLSNGE